MAVQRTIGAAAREAEVAVGTLRLYERLGVVVPDRDSTGRRVYSPRQIQRARRFKAERLAARRSVLQRTGEVPG
jgi:DNA-binding transcriptional MerR regulator